MKVITKINPKYQQDKDLHELLTHLPLRDNTDGCAVIYKKRNAVYRYTAIDGHVFVVKQFHHPNLFQSLCYSTLWTNKAIKSFAYATKLLDMGIRTPEPIAAITYKQKGRVVGYIFISSEDEGQNTEDFVAPEDIPSGAPEAARVLDALGGYLVDIHEKGFLHGDTNLSNFRFTKMGDIYEFSVIDTNRSRFLNRPATKEECLHNLCRTTHLRPILQVLIRAYARHRGWDEDKTYDAVLSIVSNFEKHKARHKQLKKILHTKNNH